MDSVTATTSTTDTAERKERTPVLPETEGEIKERTPVLPETEGEIKERTPVPGTEGETKEQTPVSGTEGEIKERTPVPGTEGENKEQTPISGTEGEIKELTPVSETDSEIKELTPVPETEVKITRKRGRPAGSKNKPKPPITMARDSANALHSHVMEIANGCDIMESVLAFSRRKQRGVCILNGNGLVLNATFRQPSGVVTFYGVFQILSFSGSFLHPPAPEAASCLTIYLAGKGGWVAGGIVAGPLSAWGPVFITAVSFGNAAYERLPLEQEDEQAAEHIAGSEPEGSPAVNRRCNN